MPLDDKENWDVLEEVRNICVKPRFEIALEACAVARRKKAGARRALF